MKPTDIDELLNDDEDGFACLTCGTGFKTFKERMEQADRTIEVINGFYAEHGRMPKGPEFSRLFDKPVESGELTYQIDEEHPA